MSAATIRRVEPDDAARNAEALAEQLAAVLLDCVSGGASVGFMLPLSSERAQAFWHGVMAATARGERALLVAEQDGAIVGTVQLLLAQPDNQPHRADVAKMLVHRSARRQGLAERLLVALEVEARREGRSVLVLDTVTGGDAERLYARCGWQAVGSVPRFALMPAGGYCATTFFHKQLAALV